jgi:hypothetical protein
LSREFFKKGPDAARFRAAGASIAQLYQWVSMNSLLVQEKRIATAKQGICKERATRSKDHIFTSKDGLAYQAMDVATTFLEGLSYFHDKPMLDSCQEGFVPGEETG